MLSIGELASHSGLSVSALRYYDGAGVLVPARVDPATGYRWYDTKQRDEARLLARLRRAGMPVADLRLVLAGWSNANTYLVRTLLDEHIRRLELGLSDARTELSTIRSLLDHRETPMPSSTSSPVRLTLAAQTFAAALDAVRFAASTDPQLPMLGGVLFDIEGDSLHVVATDRYRMAVSRATTVAAADSHVRVVVPAALTDAMRALLDRDETVQLSVEGDQVTLRAGDAQASGRCVEQDFPDYRRLVRLPAGRRAQIDVPALRSALETGPVRASEGREPAGVPSELSVLKVTDAGAVAVCEDGDDGEDHVAVNRAFLLHALAAGGRDALILEFGTAISPLAIRRADTADTFSILMPVRLDG